MTSNDIQMLVFKHLAGRYRKLLDNDENLSPSLSDENNVNFPGAFVVRARMLTGDFREFRKDCHAAGISIMAVYKVLNFDGPIVCDYVIIAAERL